MKQMLLSLLIATFLSLFPGTRADAQRTLESVQYNEFGGMAFTMLEMTLSSGKTPRLTVRQGNPNHPDRKTYSVPSHTLHDLEAYLSAYHPETWADLPDDEIFALDAPILTLTLVYSDGTEYTLSSTAVTPEGPGFLWQDTEQFLYSYTVRNPQTFTLPHSSFFGSQENWSVTVSAPEKVDMTSQMKIDNVRDGEPAPPGSGYTEVYTFRGRIPGEVDITVHVSGGFLPVGGTVPPDTVYHLTIDEEYNIHSERIQ